MNPALKLQLLLDVLAIPKKTEKTITKNCEGDRMVD